MYCIGLERAVALLQRCYHTPPRRDAVIQVEAPFQILVSTLEARRCGPEPGDEVRAGQDTRNRALTIYGSGPSARSLIRIALVRGGIRGTPSSLARL